ncbi:hypothetical protein [Lysobacter auxotrophicus]|uniref:Lipoprotein n=1 Tax=Lysobacter auxotrophicus TaxID=2992573 RepID=A0ABN6UK27_9GAMM|nr:hypothetical protein [Lysobacter auxotrophicus]BDU16659.1 hypothetical protein LA521A_18600 [Lysobacter auxotrophicus]
MLSGCGNYNYKQPSVTEPNAMLSIASDQSGLMSAQMFSSFDDAECTAPGYVMAAFNFSKENSRTLLVQPGKPLHVLATFQRTSGARVAGELIEVGSRYCNNLIAFTPELGHVYSLRQTASESKCQVELVDLRSGLPPTTFEALEVRGNCTRGIY